MLKVNYFLQQLTHLEAIGKKKKTGEKSGCKLTGVPLGAFKHPLSFWCTFSHIISARFVKFSVQGHSRLGN